LCDAVEGQYVRWPPPRPQHLNPFDLAPGGDEEGGRPSPSRSRRCWDCWRPCSPIRPTPLTAQERAVLDDALYRTYAAAGIIDDPATHGRPAPLLRDFHRVLAGRPGEAAAGLAGRLQRFVDGSLAGLFAGPTNVALDRPFVVFNVQALEAELRRSGST
jgi:hypothetical protein